MKTWKNFILVPILPVLAILTMKACGTGNSEPYPYVKPQQERIIIETYQDPGYQPTNEELKRHFESLNINQ
jgi:hypothetical protein